MNFVTAIGYHDALFEVKITLPEKTRTRSEAKELGNHNKLYFAKLYMNKIVVGKDEKRFIIEPQDTHLYQFSICRLNDSEIESKGYMLSSEDYENVSWREAMEYFKKEYKDVSLPFALEAYYYSVLESKAN